MDCPVMQWEMTSFYLFFSKKSLTCFILFPFTYPSHGYVLLYLVIFVHIVLGNQLPGPAPLFERRTIFAPVLEERMHFWDSVWDDELCYSGKCVSSNIARVVFRSKISIMKR